MHRLAELAHLARRYILETSERTATPHLSSSLSVVDILVSLGYETDGLGRDRQIYLSKGHAALAMYSVYVVLGKLPTETLQDYCSNDSVFEGHVNSRIPGIPLSTGSLGHAAPFAIGRAIADLASGSNSQHWVVMSDGELDEGSNWESFLIASHRNLGNFHIVIDRNRLQSLAPTEETSSLEPLASKFRSFNFYVDEADGHDHEQLSELMRRAELLDKPSVLIANTTKGKGVMDIEGNAILYHYKPATKAHLDAFNSTSRI
jgi:transketolase